jgi:hypothetical protein
MPLTIAQGFQKLKENLEITSLQANTVSSRQQNVRNAVAQELSVLESFLAGSYRRNTMIAPLGDADVDIFIVLDPSYYSQDGYTLLLDRTRRALARHYTTSTISRNGQAVTIKFTDFYVDVVPSFYRNGGGYLIPDSIEERWIATDPTLHIDLWSQMNAKKNGDFIPLIKMLKGWNRMHSQLLRSFHLETLAHEVLQDVRISDLPSGVRYFFDKARSKLATGILDPAGYGGNLGSYLDFNKKLAVALRFTAAYENAMEAEELERQGRTEAAYAKWTIIFGDYFPAYGNF